MKHYLIILYFICLSEDKEQTEESFDCRGPQYRCMRVLVHTGTGQTEVWYPWFVITMRPCLQSNTGQIAA